MRVCSRIVAVTVTTALVGVSGAASAGGFGIVAQSGSAIGNAFAGGAAAAEDASTIWYNPAGMGLLQGTNASVAVHAIRPSFKFENTGSTGAFAAPGTGEGGDGGDWGYVPQGYVSTSVGEKWRLGVAFNTPFGLKTNYDAGWRGQFTALKSEVTAYNLNPSVAYKVNDSVWVGAGVSVQRFTTELTNFAGPVVGNASLKASDTAWGFNLGAMLKASDTMRIGVAYRSRIAYKLSGTASFSSGGGVFDSGAQADLTVPESASINVFSSLSKQWDIMGGATWTRWSRLQTLTVVRTSASLLGPAGSIVTTLPFNWSDTMLIAVGANYTPSDDWKIRFGVAYDPAASNDAARTPRLPDQGRLLLSVGARYKLSKNGAWDFAYAHEFVKDANINDTVAGVPGALMGTFKNKADVLSLQYNHRF